MVRPGRWILDLKSHPNLKEKGRKRERNKDLKKKNNGSQEIEIRFGDEERRLMHLVPAPAVRLKKSWDMNSKTQRRLYKSRVWKPKGRT